MEWTVESLATNIMATMAFGLVGIFLALLGYKLFDWLTPGVRIEHELSEKHNVAVAIVVAAIILDVCLIVARAVGS